MRPGYQFLLILLAFACLFAPAAAADQATDLLDQQDWSSSPPLATSPLKDWIAWVQHKNDGHYYGSGQPIAPPKPPGLPDSAIEVTIDVQAGTRVTTEGGVTCTERWYKVWVSIVFDDGSIFRWMEEGQNEECSDGSETHWIETIASAGVEDIFNLSWTGWIRSYRADALQIERRMRGRAPAGGTLDLTALSPSSLPWVGSEADVVDIALGPGAVLDLRGHSGAGGPLFAPTGAITLRCDTILLDPGVQLSDLFASPPGVLPGADVRELFVAGPPMAHFEGTGPAEVELRVSNLGNAPLLATLGWIDVLAWSFGGPIGIPLAPGQQGVGVLVPLAIPPAAQPGDASLLTIQATAPLTSAVARSALLERVAASSPPQPFCTAKPNSLGCVPLISWSGTPSASGYDDFHVLASDVISNRNGILFHAPAAGGLPFQGGTLCVSGQLVRTPVQNSGGNPGNGDCSGLYSFHFGHAYLQDAALLPGTDVYCQYWSRDLADPWGSGLSDALAFQVAP
jgi:hypothetical protein